MAEVESFGIPAVAISPPVGYYQTHIQNIGWEDDSGSGWKKDGVMSGTKGLGYRPEAIPMRLTGEDADNYDLYYQIHA